MLHKKFRATHPHFIIIDITMALIENSRDCVLKRTREQVPPFNFTMELLRSEIDKVDARWPIKRVVSRECRFTGRFEDAAPIRQVISRDCHFLLDAC